MWVVTLEPPSCQTQGDHIYRSLEPSLALAEYGHVHTLAGTWLSPLTRAAAEDADVVVLCQAVDADFLPLMARRRAQGLVTVVEFNDHFLKAPLHNPVQAFYANPINSSLALQLATLADGMQFSTQALADTFGHLNPRGAVFRNAVTEALWQQGAAACRPPQACTPLRLGWGGSAGHRDDLIWLVPALKRVLEAHPSVVLCIMGAACLADIFDWVPNAQLEWRDSGSLEDYQQFLNSLDVGVAPLRQTPFNDCRSDVKYVEYTMAAVPGVFASRPTYRQTVLHDKTGLIAESTDDFVEQIERLVQSSALRQNLVLAAQAQIRAERRAYKAAQARLDYWQSLAPKDQARAKAPQVKARAWTDALPKEAQRKARAWVIGLSGAQADLHDGLLLAGHPEANKHLRRACRMAPDNYLCWLYYGLACSDAGAKQRALEQALQLVPDSNAARLALGQHLFDVCGAKSAQNLIAAGPDVSCAPYGFAPLTELWGRMALALDDFCAAQKAFRAALEQNGLYRPSATRLAQIHLQQGAPKLAEPLLQENLRQGLGHWLDAFLLGEIAREQGAWRRAHQHFQHARRLGAPAAQLGAYLAQSCAALGDKAGVRRVQSWMQATQAAAPSEP